MLTGFEVLSPGLYTTLQDEGRFGYEDCGVPPSGAMDEMSFAIANALVGNPGSAGALEFTLTGATLRLTGDSHCRFAITGDIYFTLDERPLAPYCSYPLRPGGTLRIIRARSGARGYLAVAGGFTARPVMGSVSTLTRAGLGGFAGRPLQKGDWLALNSTDTRPAAAGRPVQRLLPQYEHRPLRVVAGPQDDHFDGAGFARFLGGDYIISGQSDRMGYRLTGDAVPHVKGFNIISDAISRGSIQIPGNGQPIIAMNDRQTTGGYPKIATVIRADLARLGQHKPGDKVSFECVSVEKAESLWIGRQKLLQSWLRELRRAASLDM
ncbi:biotin-dependent carboxyltransferase family protein [Sodalis sp. RH21]|uniref:5-oxoprolinase subunit C family protein n=1 Tax=unclassified Sodalis (in: enterobacteria) TaxID=2636512 RepID=UPI0039B3928E